MALRHQIRRCENDLFRVKAQCGLMCVRLLQTFAPSAATRPMTATDSILYSHARRLHSIRSTDPFFKTTSQTYGNRMPLEQVR